MLVIAYNIGKRTSDIAQIMKIDFRYKRVLMRTTLPYTAGLKNDLQFISKEQYRILEDCNKLILKTKVIVKDEKTDDVIPAFYALDIDDLDDRLDSVLVLPINCIDNFKEYCDQNGIPLFIAGIVLNKYDSTRNFIQQGIPLTFVDMLVDSWEAKCNELKLKSDIMIDYGHKCNTWIIAKYIHEQYVAWINFQKAREE